MSKFTQADYSRAMQALMPVGAVWQNDPTSVQAETLAALAAEFQKSDQDALGLLQGAFPATATSMLSEWETSLGLPDDCAISEMDSISLRQKAVVAKLTATGGQSVSYFIQQAKALGYEITITQFRQARAGMSAAGAALNGENWPFVMLITAPSTTISYAQAGASYAGDPLRSWGNKRLECSLSRLAPAEVIVKFAYRETL
ncbi:YmfQ family protein [Pantoea ananatis]|uniref:YmfQ family protein n=1 Tax=Pantoea ananas TaxID=553 RepID=UPI003C1E0072